MTPFLSRTPGSGTLGEVPVGDSVQLTGWRAAGAQSAPVARGDRYWTRRLCQLGLRPGVQVDVLARTTGGGRLLGIAGARLAVDRATARAVRVRPLDAAPAPTAGSTATPAVVA